MNTLEETIFIKEICQRLDASIAHLQPTITERLDNARQAALLAKSEAIQQDIESLASIVSRELNENATVPLEIEARLDQIRHRAITKLEEIESQKKESRSSALGSSLKSKFDSSNLLASAGMLATACVLITAISIFYVSTRPAGSLTFEDEISLVASAEDIELYENLEFYLWLAENESNIL